MSSSSSSFSELGLSEELLKAIKSKGFEEPTEIQRKIIPMILNSEMDLVGQAQTGTGKTAAFALPIIDRLQTNAKKLQALVMVPTRELALQVSDEINSLHGHKHITVAPIYGGQSFETQFRILKRGVDIIVGTPGRILDHIGRKSLILDEIKFAVLDEADEMLNMGFIEDIETILAATNKERRTLLFSATMPDRIMTLAKKYMHKYEVVKTKKSGQTTDLTDQIYFEVKENDKFDSLCRIIDTTSEFYGLVFCRTKNDVDMVTTKLHDRGYDAEGLHGDISQNIREKILGKFRKRKVNILIATDVAARGLDIDDLTHVINFALPQDPEAYLHRIGRTGRAGKEGTAITFVNPEEFRKLKFIKSITQTEIRKERVPQVQDVIGFKRIKITNEIKSLIDYGVGTNYLMLAKDLIKDSNPEDVIAALIKYNFQNELEENSYAKIHDLYESKGDKFERGDDKRRGRSSRSDRGFGDRDRDKGRGGDRFKSERNRDEKGRGERRRDDGERVYKRKSEGAGDEPERSYKRRSDSDRDDRGFSSRPASERGKTRLFFAMGKKDNLDVKEILKLLKNKANVDPDKVSGVKVNDAFSFFTVTNKDADVILATLNKDKSKRPVVERSKDPK